jgi:hypothetical protein
VRPQALRLAPPSFHLAAARLKVSDEFVVTLCRVHHRAVHRAGDERTWWKANGIDPIKVARKLWKETREPPKPPTIEGTALQASQPAVPAVEGEDQILGETQ